MSKKTLGIIGGMGPLATAVFYGKIVKHTRARCDQDHIKTVIISDPTIPRRVEYIMGEAEESPLPAMSSAAVKLQEMGAEVIVMPCVTAHFFYEDIKKALSVPFLNMPEETALYLKKKKYKKAGILGTRATVKSALLQDCLKKNGIGSVVPNEEEAEKLSGMIFRDIKQGRKIDTGELFGIMDAMGKRGAETCLIACTDISTCLRDDDNSLRYTDLMDILAVAAVRECGGEYRE